MGDTDITRVVLFGGSGFLGAEIAQRLCAAGLDIRVATRHPDQSAFPEPPATAGNIQSVYADVRDETSVALAMEECDAVVNAVGLYVEHGAETFEAVHELGAINVAHQAANLGVHRLVHISGIGADLYSSSAYIRARAKGELLVSDVFAQATILRPSALFGPKDKFVNALAKITAVSPIFPLFRHGETKLQPVYAGDVADAVLMALTAADAQGRIYELGGPGIYSYRALIELILRQTGRRRWLLPLPLWLWNIVVIASSLFANPPITPAQIALMNQDNIVAKSAFSLAHLDVQPTAIEDILPDYKF